MPANEVAGDEGNLFETRTFIGCLSGDKITL